MHRGSSDRDPYHRTCPHAATLSCEIMQCHNHLSDGELRDTEFASVLQPRLVIFSNVTVKPQKEGRTICRVGLLTLASDLPPVYNGIKL